MSVETPQSSRGVAAVLAAISKGCAVVGGCAVLLMMLHVSLDVLSKYIFNRPIVGTLEIVSHYYMVAAIFLPLAAIERSRGHIFVELFTVKLPPRPTLVLDALSCLLSAVFAGAIAWTSMLEALRRTASREMIDAVYYRIPVWPTRWIVPLGAGLFALVCLYHTIRFLRSAFGEAAPELPEPQSDKEVDV